MAEYLIQEETLKNIANILREQNGSSELFTIDEMTQQISATQSAPTSRFGNGIGQISTFELMFCGRGDAAQYVRPLIIRR